MLGLWTGRFGRRGLLGGRNDESLGTSFLLFYERGVYRALCERMGSRREIDCGFRDNTPPGFFLLCICMPCVKTFPTFLPRKGRRGGRGSFMIRHSKKSRGFFS